MFALLFSRFPFNEESLIELAYAIINKDFELDQDENCSDECLDVLRKLLTKNALDRPTCEDILKHKWFNSVRDSNDRSISIMKKSNNVNELNH